MVKDLESSRVLSGADMRKIRDYPSPWSCHLSGKRIGKTSLLASSFSTVLRMRRFHTQRGEFESWMWH